MDHVHPHLAVHVLERGALVFASGGLVDESTLRTLPGSRWNLSHIAFLSAVLILPYFLTVGGVEHRANARPLRVHATNGVCLRAVERVH